MAKKFFRQLKTRVPALNIRQISKKKNGTFISKYKYTNINDWENYEENKTKED